MKATAVANANMALVKYWGKRDSKLILPHNSSISMTWDGIHTVTTVDFSPKYSEDSIVVNDEELKKDEKDVLGHVERIRQIAGLKEKAKVVSESNFPVAAGLASSASGLAALTVAACEAAGLKMTEKQLTILARQGSGSASRSISEGFVEWHRGQREDGHDSYAESIAPKKHWPEFRMITTILSETKKPVSSRAGMAQTVATCPYYGGWLASIEEDLKKVREGILQKDFEKVGATAEMNALKMHATMMTTNPPIIYWIPPTLEIIHAVRELRESGTQCYFTMDAGPNVKVMCLQKDEAAINRHLLSLEGVKKTLACGPGDGTKSVNKHLF
jgi:diphosphomevalonate decarboxylase